MADLRGPFDPVGWKRRIAVARGEAPADLLLTNARVVDVFSETLFPASVAVADGVIASIGEPRTAEDTVDCDGMVLAPSFIDAHVHIESSLLWMPEFARAVVPHGTGAVVADPHEIANVAGIAGISALRDAAAGLPLEVRLTAPSCVPASQWESSGASIGADAIAEMLAWPESAGLGELMNFPGVLSGNDEIAAKVASAHGRPIDGHAPGLSGSSLQAYAGSGPGADHESTVLEEAREKLRAGLMVMIREGSSAKNLHALLPLVTDATYPRCCFASDDRDVHTLLHHGHMDDILRKAIAAGLDPLRAIRLATWNPANHWRLDRVGAVAPGYLANLVLIEHLTDMKVAMTTHRGRIVARDGRLMSDLPDRPIPERLTHSVNVAPVMLRDLRLDPSHARTAVGIVPGQIVTQALNVNPVIRGGDAVADAGQDLLKLICVERHHATGRVGVGYVKGLGLKRGAIASTIAHDAHNIIAAGVDDTDILGAIAVVAESQGGLAVVADGQVLAHLPLPVAGLLSDRPADEVASGFAEAEETARALGSTLPSPFGILSFLALSVIPEARVTDRGPLRI